MTLYGRFAAFKFSANQIDKVILSFRPICHTIRSCAWSPLFFTFFFFFHGDISWTAPFVFLVINPTLPYHSNLHRTPYMYMYSTRSNPSSAEPVEKKLQRRGWKGCGGVFASKLCVREKLSVYEYTR